MGWTFRHKEHNQSFMSFFEEVFNYENNGRKGTIVDFSKSGTVCYMAFKVEENGKHLYTTAIVCLTDGRGIDYCNLGYKDMGEEMGPYYYDCPQRILKQLTPAPNDYAIEWRKKCWDKFKNKNGMLI